MKQYESSAPRATFAAAAVMMTAITIAVSIFVPASVQSGATRSSVLAEMTDPAIAGTVSSHAATVATAHHVWLASSRAVHG